LPQYLREFAGRQRVGVFVGVRSDGHEERVLYDLPEVILEGWLAARPEISRFVRLDLVQ
jgi:hypothetical protein